MGNIVKNIKLDKKYRPISTAKNMPYEDRFSILVGDILDAQTSGKINKDSLAILLTLALQNEIKNDVLTITKTFYSEQKQQSESRTMLMQLTKTNNVQHA